MPPYNLLRIKMKVVKSHLIISMLEMHRKEMLEASDRVHIALEDPSLAVVDAITEAGGKKLGERYSVWCHSAGQTCSCNSHDPGQNWVDFEVPQDWLYTSRQTYRDENLTMIFELKEFVSDFNLSPRLVIPIPTKGDVKFALVWTQCRTVGWASSTYLARQRA